MLKGMQNIMYILIMVAGANRNIRPGDQSLVS